jgi:hypothetical protein
MNRGFLFISVISVTSCKKSKRVEGRVSRARSLASRHSSLFTRHSCAPRSLNSRNRHDIDDMISFKTGLVINPAAVEVIGSVDHG